MFFVLVCFVLFCFVFMHVLIWTVALALFVCALVACMAAYAEAIAVALATTVCRFGTGARGHCLWEQQHAILQFAKVGVNPLNEWPSKIRHHVFEVLDHSQRHLNHGLHGERFHGSRGATFNRCAPVTNAFPVLVDLGVLNLHRPNHHLAMIANVFQQCRNGRHVFATHVIRSLCNTRVELTLNRQKVVAEQCITARHNAELRIFHLELGNQ